MSSVPYHALNLLSSCFHIRVLPELFFSKDPTYNKLLILGMDYVADSFCCMCFMNYYVLLSTGFSLSAIPYSYTIYNITPHICHVFKHFATCVHLIGRRYTHAKPCV